MKLYLAYMLIIFICLNNVYADCYGIVNISINETTNAQLNEVGENLTMLPQIIFIIAVIFVISLLTKYNQSFIFLHIYSLIELIIFIMYYDDTSVFFKYTFWGAILVFPSIIITLFVLFIFNKGKSEKTEKKDFYNKLY